MLRRATDIEALFGHARRELAQIEASYSRSLEKSEIEADLKIEIKNLCENMRSALDYVARDIRETHCPTADTRERFYFPIFGAADQFVSQVAKWYPGLRTIKPELWKYLESVQPYARPENTWLALFNRLNNENKHEALVPQTRRETEQVKVTTKGSGSVSWNPAGVRFERGVHIGGVPVDPATRASISEQWVFEGNSGKTLDPGNLARRQLYPALGRLGLPRFSWHRLRKLHSTYLGDLKVAPRILQAQLGHADAALTLNVYTQVIPESQRRAIESLEGLLFRNVPKPKRQGRVQ